MKKRAKIFLLIVFLLAGLFILRLITAKPVSKPAMGRAGVEKVTVKITEVKKEDLNVVLSYAGSLKAKDEVNVFSKVSGKLVEYKLNEGESVQKGETIAFIDRDETGLKYELAPVESPISGILGKTLLDKGANILPSAGLSGGTPLAIVVNMDEMIVRLNIPEVDIPYMKKGLEAQIKVDAYPQDNFAGEITKVSEVVDIPTRTLPIEITVPNQDRRLKSGMFSRIKINAYTQKDVLVLPQDAFIQELGTSYVFIVEDRIAKKKKVITGIREDSRVEIRQGVQEKDKVIVFGQQGLKDGTQVEAVTE